MPNTHTPEEKLRTLLCHVMRRDVCSMVSISDALQWDLDFTSALTLKCLKLKYFEMVDPPKNRPACEQSHKLYVRMDIEGLSYLLETGLLTKDGLIDDH